MDQTHTEIVIVLDRSGSMQNIRSDMEGGLNRFFEEQKAEPGRCSVTLTQFDDEYEITYSGKDLHEVPQVVLVPRGGTALLDAVGRTINEVDQRLADTPEADSPGRVIFVIVTDGEENSSKEFSHATINQMIDNQTAKHAWTFVYLGANQDAIAEGRKLGIVLSAGYAATPAGAASALQSMSRSLRSFRKGGRYN